MNIFKRIINIILASMVLFSFSPSSSVDALSENKAAEKGQTQNIVPNEIPAGLTGSEWTQIKSLLPQPAETIPTEKAILHASDAQTDDDFGWEVSISGDTLVVGVRSEDGGAAWQVQSWVG